MTMIFLLENVYSDQILLDENGYSDNIALQFITAVLLEVV